MNAFSRKTVALLSVGIFAFSAYLLVTSSPWLLIEAIPSAGLPLGTFISWAGIASLPVAPFLWFRSVLERDSALARICRSSMIGLLGLCGTWGLVSYGLAGNWAFNFSRHADSFQGSAAASRVFWTYSISLVAATLLTSLVLLALALFIDRRSD